MKPRRSFPSSRRAERGSVFIIVMWTCLGIVALTLYFANSMTSELRAADNRVTETEARQAVAGGIRYATYVLTNHGIAGILPLPTDYSAAALPVGDAQFWFIGRDYGQSGSAQAPSVTEPYFGFIDESSKLNLNTATRAMLMELPNMTDALADAIIAWRTAATAQNASGNASQTYASLSPARQNKGGPFESVDELRLVDGATLDILLGEDTNRNGVLDPNEDDGEQSAPRDNQDGQLQAGLLEYLTVYTRIPTTKADGTRRVNIVALTNTQDQQHQQAVNQYRTALLARGLAAQRVAALVNVFNPPGAPGGGGGGGRGGPGGGAPGGGGAPTVQPVQTIAEFMLASRMTLEEFDAMHADFTTVATGASTPGLVNVNTASAVVLACIPGIGQDNAATLVAYRQNHPEIVSFFWLTQVLPNASIRQAARYITDQSYQFTADIAAVGHFGRGYCREKVIFDMSTRTPRIVFHQDLTSYGWALGSTVRQTLKGDAQ